MKVLPYLKVCSCLFKKPKKSFRKGLQIALLNKLGMKMSKSEQKIEDDPFLLVGFGFNAYLDMIKYLGILFALLALISLPSMYIYSKYGVIRNDKMGTLT